MAREALGSKESKSRSIEGIRKRRAKILARQKKKVAKKAKKAKKVKPSATHGRELLGQSAMLAHQSRHSATLSNASKVKAGKASAKRLVAGTIEVNQAKRAAKKKVRRVAKK